MKIAGLVLVIALFSGCSPSRLKLNSIYTQDVIEKTYTVDPAGYVLKTVDIVVKDVIYTLGLDKDNKVCFVFTLDKEFTINDVTMNSKLSDIKAGEVQFIPGWGYYIEVGKEWYAGFDYVEKPVNDSKIGWFFKYDMREAPFGNYPY